MKKYFLSKCTIVLMVMLMFICNLSGYSEWAMSLPSWKKELMGHFVPSCCLLLIIIIIDQATIRWRTSEKVIANK
jgi:hypothetical protein